MCPPGALPQHIKSGLATLPVSLYQLTSLCQLAQAWGNGKKPPEHHQKVFGAFLSMESWQMELS